MHSSSETAFKHNTRRFVCATHKPFSGEEGRVDITKASLVSMAELTAQQGIEQEMAVRTHNSLLSACIRQSFVFLRLCLSFCETEPGYGHGPCDDSNLKE